MQCVRYRSKFTGVKSMFSWKNIKDTFNDKVINGADAKEKTLGTLEVLGKSVVSGAVGLGKFTANNLMDELTKANRNLADKNEKSLKELSKDSSLTYEERQELEAKIEKFQENKVRILEGRIRALEDKKSKLDNAISEMEVEIKSSDRSDLETFEKLESKKSSLEFSLRQSLDEIRECRRELEQM